MSARYALVLVGIFAILGLHADDEPASFMRIGATGDWDTPGSWEADPAGRNAPGILGDTATITGKVTVTMSADKTLSTLNLRSKFGNNEPSSYTLEGAGKVLTLKGVDGEPAVLTDNASGVSYQRSSIGNWAAGSTMLLKLEDPLKVTVSGSDDYKPGHLIVAAKVTGGTEAKPSDITLSTVREGHLILTNPNNDFRGDVIYDSANAKTAIVALGFAGKSGSDAILGSPLNEVYFAGKGAVLELSNFGAEGLKRKVHGSGAICGRSRENSWFIATTRTAILGDGCEIDPSNGSSPYGTITVVGTTITINTNATFKMSIGSTGNDLVQLKPTAAFTFRGRIEIDEETEVAAGSQFTLFTIDKGAGSVTFSPDYAPDDYNFVCDGNAANGWTVVATKRRTGADVSALGTTLIADFYATFNCNVFQVGSSPVTVRAYYGTTDAGDNPSGWSTSTVVAENVTATGVYSVKVQGLSNNTTYFVRYGVDDGVSVQMSVDVVSFTTRDYNTPDTFTWNFSGSAWSEAGAWTIAGPYARQNPGTVGDIVRIPKHADHLVLVDGDYTVSKMYLENGQNQAVKLTAAEPHVLTLDNGSEAALLESGNQVYHWYFGTNTTDGLSLQLASPLKISRTAAYAYDFWLYAKLSGGTTASPVPITLSCTSDEYGRLYVHLFNIANDFIGDWFIGIDGNAKGKTIVYLGDATHPSADSMLGHADNHIMLRSLSTLAYFAGNDSAASCRRQISGDGAITCTGNFALTDEAELSPCGKTGTGFGTIKVTASGTLSDTASSTYRLDVSSASYSSSDAIEFKASGELGINGKFVITPDDPSVKIAVSTNRWTIGTLTGTGLPARKVFPTSEGFRVFAEGDAENGWKLYAQKTAPGLTVVLH